MCGTRSDAIFNKINAEARFGECMNMCAVNSVTTEFPPYALAPGIVGNGRNPRRSQTQPCAGGRYVGFCPADLDVEDTGCLKAPWRRNSKAQKYFAKRN